MVRHYIAGAVLAGVAGSLPSAVSATANPVWEIWGNLLPEQNSDYLPPARPANIFPEKNEYRLYGVSYSGFPADNDILSDFTRTGLSFQEQFLQQQNPYQKVAPGWANISNAALLETVRALQNWRQPISPGALQERFSLHSIGSAGSSAQAEYTGYFTPVLEVSSHRTGRYRIPIYRKPGFDASGLTHAAIARGALAGKDLEIAWTDDPIGLYFAQIQGSALARFTDGGEFTLDFAGSNGYGYESIAKHMKSQGYKPRNWGNDGIREWLSQHPDKLGSILTSNPRYIFFRATQNAPKTASGTHVIPGHTVAVDSRYIPHGAVLLAEVPQIDRNGKKVGSEWRLLFAQDRGKAINGKGRLDMYTGQGKNAENLAHAITGLHKAYMLVRKPGYGQDTHLAGL